jgi:DNA repair protein RadC
MTKNIKEWPDTEKPRERLLTRGPKGLTDGELLALVLGASRREGGGVLGTSRELLAHFGGLRGVMRSHPGALMKVPGIGQARACALVAVMELARRLEDAAAVRGRPVCSSRDAYDMVRSRLVLLDHEVFVALTLDAKHRVLGIHKVAQGSATSVEVHPREVYASVVREAGAAVIVAHNHPSGDPDPSAEDCDLTDRLVQAGNILGIPLLDHLVVGAGRFVSMADRGLL